jgi:hypothetical protein
VLPVPVVQLELRPHRGVVIGDVELAVALEVLVLQRRERLDRDAALVIHAEAVTARVEYVAGDAPLRIAPRGDREGEVDERAVEDLDDAPDRRATTAFS